ncbi:MAG: hypothetical protein AABZ32_12510, partial [Bacteroidota bacterium]
WYEVKDPNEVKSRVTLCNGHPSYLFVMAKKIAESKIFADTPQQSDYQNLLWEHKGNTNQLQLNQHRISFVTKFSNLFTHLSALFKEIGDGNKDFFKKI